MTDQAQQPRPAPVDFARLNREITKEPDPSPPPEQFKPPHMRSSFLTNKGSSDLKMICDSLKRLVWDDCEKLGALVAKNLPNNNIDGPAMSKAIQTAADELRNAEGTDG